MESQIVKEKLKMITPGRLNFIMAVLMIFVFLSVFFIFKDGNSCLQNPFTYGANEVTKNVEDLSLSCSCFFSDPQYHNFIFNEKDLNFGTILDNIDN